MHGINPQGGNLGMSLHEPLVDLSIPIDVFFWSLHKVNIIPSPHNNMPVVTK